MRGLVLHLRGQDANIGVYQNFRVRLERDRFRLALGVGTPNVRPELIQDGSSSLSFITLMPSSLAHLHISIAASPPLENKKHKPRNYFQDPSDVSNQTEEKKQKRVAQCPT